MIRRWLGVQTPVQLYLAVVAVLLPLQFTDVIRRGITLFHIVNFVVVGGFVLLLILRGVRIRWYLLFPMWLLLVASLLGMFNSSSVFLNTYTLSIDVYIYVWFLMLAAFIASEDDVNVLTRVWVLMAAGIVLFYLRDLSSIGAIRSEFTFGNPNRAGTYFMASFYFLFSPALTGRPWLRAGLGTLFFTAALATTSVAILVSFVLSGFVMLITLLYTRGHGRQIAALSAVMLLIVAGFAVARTDPEQLVREQLPLVFLRAPRSLSTRTQIWTAGLEIFQEHPFGIGPQSFFAQVDIGLGNKGGIELHSDFVANLVERGFLGLLALFLVYAVVGLRLLSMARAARRLQRRDLGMWTGALAGVVVGYFVYSVTHQALHHDTLWLIFALIFAQSEMVRRAEGLPAAAPAASALPRVPVPAAPGLRRS